VEHFTTGVISNAAGALYDYITMIVKRSKPDLDNVSLNDKSEYNIKEINTSQHQTISLNIKNSQTTVITTSNIRAQTQETQDCFKLTCCVEYTSDLG